MRNLTRRSFLAGAAALPLSLWLEQNAFGQAPLIRHDARSPQGQAMLATYAEAVGKMQKAAEGDPRGWVFQWYTHWVRGSATKAAEIQRIYPSASPSRDLAEEVWDTCQAHGAGEDENMFLPWHRMFVYYFESIIRVVTNNNSFTLPYWNYSASDPATRGVIPPEFRKQGDAIFGPLYVDKRNPGVNQGKPIQQGLLGDPLSLEALAQCFYEPEANIPGFCQDLDQGLHGAVHVLVGNGQNMGSVPWAAGDPIFWMHHCNIDRLWASWNAAGRTNPALTGAFVFADRNGNRVLAKVQDVLDTAGLGYAYDRLEKAPDCPTPKPMLVAAAENQKRIAAMKPTSVKLGAGPVQVPLELTPEREGVAPTPLADRVKSLGAGRHLYLVVKDLRAEAQPGVLYQLYLDLPPGASEEQAKAHYVGTLNFFNAAAHGEHDHAATEKKAPAKFFRFDITDVAKALQAKKLLADKPTLTIAPAGEPAAEAKPVIGEITLVEQ